VRAGHDLLQLGDRAGTSGLDLALHGARPVRPRGHSAILPPQAQYAAAMTDRSSCAALSHATARLDPPLAALDLTAARANLSDLVRRAGGTPVRIASKSVRCRWVLDLALSTPGVRGVMAFALREALWLAAAGVDDVLIGYPSADRG